jgi:hypothetical protein
MAWILIIGAVIVPAVTRIIWRLYRAGKTWKGRALFRRGTPLAIDTRAVGIDTKDSIDTVVFEPKDINKNIVSPLINGDSIINAPHVDTSTLLIPVSMGVSMPKLTGDASREKGVLTTARPRRPDPLSPLCTMEAPPELEPIQVPDRFEPSSGTKEDLGINEWAVTEFGRFWWGQTDEELRDRSIQVQTEAMREDGEFLHWYEVRLTSAGRCPAYMSARSGPEACVKVERGFGKGWAQSWKYLRPAPHRGPFFDHKVFLVSGDPIVLVARTIKDAISMVEAVWGPGHVLYVERMSRPSDGHLLT